MTYIIGHSDKAKFARVFSFPDLLNFKCLNFILVSNHFWLDLWICDERWKSSSSLSQFRVRITSSHTPDSIFYPHHKPDPKPINLFDVGRRGLSGASHFFSFLISVISSSSLGWRETTGEKQAGAQEGGDSAHAETDISRRCCDDELPAN
jgi:hypothetical protein